MGGQGPAPKPAEQRRNKRKPLRGEWVDLEPLTELVLPDLPEGDWSVRTEQAWEAWRQDPVTSQYLPADVQAAIDLAYLYDKQVKGNDFLAAEVRQRQDRLGLNPKGKRDLRWRVGEAEVVPTSSLRQQKRARQRRAKLHVVA